MTINVRRAVFAYPANEFAVTYVAANEYHQISFWQQSQSFSLGSYDPSLNTFPSVQVAIAYYDTVLPQVALGIYNTQMGASETLGTIAEFNGDAVRSEIASVQSDVDTAVLQLNATHLLAETAVDDAASALSAVSGLVEDIEDVQTELAGIVGELASAASVSDFQTGASVPDTATDLPTNLSALTQLGTLVGCVNDTNVRVNLLASRLNSLISALESKTILTP